MSNTLSTLSPLDRSRVLTVVWLYADAAAGEGRLPTRSDIAAYIGRTDEALAAAVVNTAIRTGLLELHGYGKGNIRCCTPTPAGWLALGRTPPARGGPGRRKCLRCHAVFPSSGPGNRLCPSCADYAERNRSAIA